MYELINNTPLPIREYSGQRVVTFKDIDGAHQRPDGTARKRFNDNRKHFIEGVDFFKINQPSEIRTLGFERPQGGTPEAIILVTLTGYLMIAKSLTDDLSWGVQRMLVSYFTDRPTGTYSELLSKYADLESRLNEIESKLTAKAKPRKSREETQRENAVYVMEKLEQAKETTITKSKLLRECRTLNARELTEALKLLDEMHFISYLKIQNGGRGKPKELIIILQSA
ncbi:MAG: ORF6N domain-containing protein [Ruminococcus flavefaciens]|nr:ORF6N domain-containing protein [Ruminococcus flavefaciens]